MFILKNRFFILVLLSTQTFSLYSCNSQDIYPDKESKLVPPNDGIYHGAFPDMGETEDSVTSERIQEFIDLVEKPPAWIYFSNNWFNGINFPKKEVELINNYGLLPFIRLMPRSDWDIFSSDPVYSLQNIIDGKFDQELIRWAEDTKQSGVPIMIEFGTEVNGDWFPWAGLYNGNGDTQGYGDTSLADGPERFKDAYIHIIDLFNKEDVKNVTWAFHVNCMSAPEESWNNMSAYYPGDEYIDWIGVSIYGAQKPGDQYHSFDELLSKSYNEMSSISENKPLAVFEFGVVEGVDYFSKALWIKDALNILKEGNYPRIKAISYWHSSWMNEDSSFSNMRIDSTPESLKQYKETISDPFFISFPILSDKKN